MLPLYLFDISKFMKENKALNITLTAIRIFVGVLFIFSGLIKANDPMGLAYKMGEFFEVWAREGYLPSLMEWLNNFSLMFSIIMITFEIVAGIALIIGYRFKLFSYLILLLTIFFTFLTGYALFSGNIKECGCFGDCIKLQANESFMKDLILLALLLILVFFRKRIKQSFKNSAATAIIILTFIVSIFFQWYALKHLPFKDCLAYRVGNNLWEVMHPKDYKAAVYETKLIYEKDGVKKEFTDKNFPWEDSTWKFVDSKSTEVSPAQNESPVKDFTITNYDGMDITESVLTCKENIFILFVKDVKEANTSNMESLVKLVDACKKANIPIIAISSSDDIQTGEFKAKNKLDIEFNTIDATACKTAMRTNPGLMWLNDGTIKGKWSYADYPNFEKLSLKANSIPFGMEAQPEPVVSDSTVSNPE